MWLIIAIILIVIFLMLLPQVIIITGAFVAVFGNIPLGLVLIIIGLLTLY
jgi:hypothetical protein